jgi:hypothetical protein
MQRPTTLQGPFPKRLLLNLRILIVGRLAAPFGFAGG